MHVSAFSLMLLISFALKGMCAVDMDLPIFTDKDMNQLSQKIGKSLRNCNQLKGRPDVVVEIQNNTNDFFDKTKFSELIHGEVEGKTHVTPETRVPQYEIDATLKSNRMAIHDITKLTYTLTAEVFQREDKLCEKSVMISKNLSPSFISNSIKIK